MRSRLKNRPSKPRLPGRRKRPGKGAAELSELEGGLDRTTPKITGYHRRIDEIKKRLDDTNIPALTVQMEKKKKEIEESERRLRNKEADINDSSRGAPAL